MRILHKTGIIGSIALLFAPVALAQKDADWAAEVRPYLETYRSGDYLETQRRCGDALAVATDARVRRELGAIQALALLRSPERHERLSGKTVLYDLSQEYPALAQRAECELALGIAAAALHETGEALDQLDRAASAFAAANEAERAAVALSELASAWADHHEWDRTPPRFQVSVPAGPAESWRVRIEQIQQVKRRVADLPAGAEASAAVDLLLAQLLLEHSADVEQPLSILENLAHAPQMNAVAVQAAMRLAEAYENLERWADAEALYRRVQGATTGESADAARKRGAAIREPAIELNVPVTLGAGQPLAPMARARNVARLEIDVRSVNLPAWLESNKGRFVESQLPDSGTMLASHTFDTAASAPHAWWDSTAAGATWDIQPPVGAYVIIARGQGGDGRDHDSRKLLIVSDLQAAVFVGKRQAVLWSIAADGAKSDATSADFWMQGAFAPTHLKLNDGLATFNLPAESNQPGYKRWLCLVRRGEQMALCRGELTQTAQNLPESPSVALMTSGLVFSPGQTLELKGLVIPPRGQAVRALAGQPVSVEIADIEERVFWTRSAKVSDCGAFQSRIPITREMGGSSFRIVVRGPHGVMPNARRQIGFSVVDDPPDPNLMRLSMPAWVDSSADRFVGQVRGEYPWGVPLAERAIQIRFSGIQFPDSEARRLARVLPPVALDGQLDANGRFDFEVPFASLGIDGRFAAIQAVAELSTKEKLRAHAVAQTLRSTEPTRLWISSKPALPVVGTPVTLTVRCLDIVNESNGDPHLKIMREGKQIASPQLRRHDDVYVSEPWAPPSSGDFEASATLSVAAGREIETRRAISVLDPQKSAPSPSGAAKTSCRAHRVGSGSSQRVTVEIDRSDNSPLLAVLEDGEPLSAVVIDGNRGSSSAELPAPGGLTAMAQVILSAQSHGNIELLNSCPVLAESQSRASLSIRTPSRVVAPGAAVPIEVRLAEGTSAQPADLTVRLTCLDEDGIETWWDYFDESYEPGPVETVLRLAESARGAESAPVASFRTLPGELGEALFSGANLALASPKLVDGAAHLNLTLPPRGGRYCVRAIARAADGTLVTDALTLQAGRGQSLSVDMPRRLTLGDRAAAVVTLRNSTPDRFSASIAVSPGQGTAIESPSKLSVDVEPDAAKTISIPFEAARLGAYEFTVSIQAADGVLERSATYEVVAGTAAAAGRGTGWITDSRVLRAADFSRNWLREGSSVLFIERTTQDVIVDAGLAWLEASLESVDWQALQLSWASALLRVDPSLGDRTVAELLQNLPLGVAGRRRLDRYGRETLRDLEGLALQRLNDMRQKDGGWGYWDDQVSQPDPTAWALITARRASPASARDLLGPQGWLLRRLTAVSNWTAMTGDAQRELSSMLLSLGPSARGDKAASARWTAAADSLARSFDALGVYERSLLVLALLENGRRNDAVRVFEAALPNGAAPTAAEASVAHAIARMKLATTPSELSAATDKLLETREGYAWSKATLTAWALATLSDAPRQAPATLEAIHVRRGDEMFSLPNAAGARWLEIPVSADLTIEGGSGGACAAWVGHADDRAPRDDSPNTLVVNRAILKLVRVKSAPGEKAIWIRSPMTEGEVLSPGQFILIRDELTLPSALKGVEWIQTLPSTCRPWYGPAEEQKWTGHLHDRSDELLSFVASRLEAGERSHECILMALRPGVCVFPSPELRAGGLPVPMRVTANAQHISVSQ